MNIKDFILGLKEEMEIESTIDLKTNLKELEEWDSLNAMILISYVNECFGISLTGQEIEKISTIESLVERIGVEKFDSVL